MYPLRHEFVQLAKYLGPQLGYQGDINEELSLPGSGLCFGLCCVIVEELHSGKMFELEQQLIQLKELIDKVQILEPDNFDKLPKNTKDNIRTLFKNILIHHYPDKFLAIQNAEHKTYNGQDLAKTTHTTHPEDLGLHKVAAFCGVYNVAGNDLGNYLRILKESSKALPTHIPFTLFLCNENDATLLGYDPKHPTEPWFFCDFEGTPVMGSESKETKILTRAKFDDIENLEPFLKVGLSRKAGVGTEVIISSEFWCLINDYPKIEEFVNLFLSQQMANRKLLIEDSHDTADPFGRTCFDKAAGIGDIAAIQWFIEHKVDVNYCNPKNGWSPLMCAAQNGEIEVVRLLLLQNGVDVDLVNPENGDTALIYAVEMNHIKVVVLLLQNNANIHLLDKQGNSVLMIAAYKGFTEIINLLLQRNADINLRNPKNGFSASMFAAQNGHTDALNLLLQHGASLNFCSTNYRYSALMLAAEKGLTDVVNLLLQHESDLNLRNRYDRSALILALLNKHTEIALRLIESGANIALRIIEPGDIIASENLEEELVSLLEQHPARLILPVLNAFYKTAYFNYKKHDSLKEIFQQNFDILFSQGEFTEEDKKTIIKLYIVLRDDTERQTRSSITTIPGSLAFFRTEYAQTKRKLTAVFNPLCAYLEKRKAALQLLEAVENAEMLPQHPALEEGILGHIAKRCFPTVEREVSIACSI